MVSASIPTVALTLLLGTHPGTEQSPEWLTPTETDNDACWVQPLQLSIFGVAGMGRTAHAVARTHCLRRLDAQQSAHPRRTLVVGKTRFGSLTLFGERLAVGLDVVVMPGRLGAPDTILAAPTVDLPERWQLAIDRATYPVLVIGGAAIVTTVLLDLLR